MNNLNKLLVAVLVVGLFAFAPTANAQNAGEEYGTQVLDVDNEFRPDLDAGADIGGGVVDALWHDGEDDDSFADDIVLLDVDESTDVSQYDLVLATGGYGGTEVGDLVEVGNTAILGLTFVATDVCVVYADVNENDRYDEGDWVFLTTDDVGDGCDTVGGTVDSLEATAVGGATFTVRLTSGENGDFGTLVRSTDDDFDDYAATASDNPADYDESGGDVDPVAEFAFYDSEDDGVFEGDMDRAYIVPAGAVAAGDPVPLYSVIIFNGELGDQVVIGGTDFSPELTELDLIDDLDVIRYDVGTDDDAFDDVFALDLDLSGDLSRYDLIIATDGFAGTAVGDLVGLGDTLLLGEGAEDEIFVLTADVDENGEYNDGDWLFVCSGAAAELLSSDDADFCVRLTDTDGGEAGSLIRTGDDDLDDWETGVDDESAAAELGFFDADNDGDFEGGDDMLWADIDGVTTGDLLDLYSIVLFGGTFGDQTGIDDENFVPDLTATTGDDAIEGADGIIRFDAGTDETFTDDVFAIDNDDSGDLSQYDLIIASGNSYGGPGVGDLVDTEDELLVDNGAVVAVEVFFIDVNEDGIYNEGDWVIICSDATLIATSVTEFCIRMTETDSGAAGSLVRTGDDDLQDWDGSEGSLAAAEVGFYDVDNDGDFEGADGDLLFLSPVAITTGDRVPIFSLRLHGDFSIVPGTTPPTPPVTTPPVTTPPVTTPPVTTPPTDPPVTPPGGEEDPDDEDEPTPGFELVALLAALGAALILVRRKA